MLIKIDLTGAFSRAATSARRWPALETPIFLLLATRSCFSPSGSGVRWVGAPGVWRAIRREGRRRDAAAWRLLAWGVVAGMRIPSCRDRALRRHAAFYLDRPVLMWIFAAAGLVVRSRASAGGRPGLAAAIAVRSRRRCTTWRGSGPTRERPPRVALSRDEIDDRRPPPPDTDPETTVILHDRPLPPSLTTIVSGRRIVLGWDVRYSAVGGEERLRDVNAFLASSRRGPDAAFEILRRYHVTHVIVRPGSPRACGRSGQAAAAAGIPGCVAVCGTAEGGP